MSKIYYGVFARYFFDSKRDGNYLGLKNGYLTADYDDWHKTLGSYKLVDNEDGTYSSFEVNHHGGEYLISENKKFNIASLELELKTGKLVPAEKYTPDEKFSYYWKGG